MLDFIVNTLLFWLVVILLVLQIWVVLFHGGVPNIRTAPAIRKRMISYLRDDFAARGHAGYTIIDLGSGNGLFTREIARALPHARVVGLEMAAQSVAWANWFKRREKLDSLSYVKGDFFAYDFSNVDAIVMYQLPGLMRRISDKINTECKTGTLILCNKFPLNNGWQPDEKLKVRTLYFHQGDMLVYRKAS